MKNLHFGRILAGFLFLALFVSGFAEEKTVPGCEEERETAVFAGSGENGGEAAGRDRAGVPKQDQVLLIGMLFLILCSLFSGILEILRKICSRNPEKDYCSRRSQ